VPRPTLSERFEQSSIGQLIVSVLIVLLVLAQVGTHLPDSAIEDEIGGSANEIIRMVASEQSWGVFAPNPRSTSLRLEGRVYFEDGSMRVWTVPEGPRVLANLRFYRWRKWLERVRDDDYQSIWKPTAAWIATQYEDEDSPVERVELVRLFHDNSLDDPQPPYEEFTYYTLDLTEAGS
jgi:hypothetical protein